MWVADCRDDKVYAYDLASGARVAAQDIDTLSATATDNPWGLWSDGASMLIASIEEGHLARHDVPSAPEPTGWTIGSGCTVGANAPEPTEVVVDAIPIVVSSTTDDYFVLYASFDVDGQTWEMPVAVVLGEAGTTTLTENAEALAQDRYRIEKIPGHGPCRCRRGLRRRHHRAGEPVRHEPCQRCLCHRPSRRLSVGAQPQRFPEKGVH